GLRDAARGGAGLPEPFFPQVPFEARVPAPADFFGFPLGARPVTHAETQAYVSEVAASSPHVDFFPYGVSHEGRTLFAALITRADRLRQREALRARLAALADPRRGEPPDLSTLPVCVYAGACVHGDETSGTDAALALLYYLAAGEDSLAASLRERLFVLLDPLQNPDGRDRVLAQWRSIAGRVPDGDDQSVLHDGIWPGGRTNHYLFDLNRDWFRATQPESQGRLRMITGWNPHLLIDAHEMGSQDSYLFSPPREPFNPMISEHHHHWWRLFASDQAAAFDAHGWDYYTREWHEEWFPGFASSWGNGIGAVGILYEQAGVEGSRVARRDGTLLTYRETVHHQLVSFLANLRTAAEWREDLLRAYRQERARVLGEAEGGYVILPSGQTRRRAALRRALAAQRIEVYRTTAELPAPELVPYWSDAPAPIRRLPAGSWIVPSAQPHGGLIETILAFDPQMDEAFLRSERRRLERERRSRLYEHTGWSASISSGLPVYRAETLPEQELERLDGWEPERLGAGQLERLEEGEREQPGERGRERLQTGASQRRDTRPARLHALPQQQGRFGFLIDGRDDASLEALVGLWEAGARVHLARDSFRVEGRDYARGTLLVKRAVQPHFLQEETLGEHLRQVASETGVTAIGVGTALSEEGPDLGGNRFRLLRAPGIAILTGGSVDWSSYGTIRWLLDHQFGYPTTALWISEITEWDLGRYDVIVLPAFWGGPERGRRSLGAAGLERLRHWTEEGGTLVAVGSAAALLADSSSGLGSTRLRREVLTQLAERAAREGERRGDLRTEAFHDAGLAWARAPRAMDGLLSETVAALSHPEPRWDWAADRTPAELREEDARLRLFHPRGALLRVDLDPRSWLTAGAAVQPAGREWIAAPLYADHALIAGDPRHAPATFGAEDSLRLAGLLWPEARQRWAHTAYLTREPLGRGQLILFAGRPGHRGAHPAAQRLFLNAALLGPGMGTRGRAAR
ncbi:MAG: hypothetical protein GF330_13085, partial [Candidatus Eisenbacteria bacterium]|nr:hypothetical protein [Candidatus Eisenbacteria bacterium]